MNFTINDELLAGLDVTQEQAVLDFAIGLYTEGKVTVGRAALIAQIPQAELVKELGRRKIPMSYDLEEFAVDLETVERLLHS